MATTSAAALDRSCTNATLRPGQFYGAVGERWQTGLVTLSVVEHAAPRVVPTHRHAHMYLSLLLRGGYREWVGGHELAYAPMTAVFHPEALEHEDEITAPGSVFFIVEIDPALLGGRARRHRGLSSVRDVSGGPAVWAMVRLLDALRDGARRDALDAEEPVVEILDHLTGAEVAATPPRWLARVEARLRDACAEPASLKALAKVAGVHPVHVARVFRRHHGCTMREQLHRLRVLDASRRIAAGAPLAEVALASGFCDQSHLTHVFRAVTGMTPSAYRATYQPGRSASTRRSGRTTPSAP
jgi:AraC family transcriptional regulator